MMPPADTLLRAPVLGFCGRFDAERALALMAKYRVKHLPLPDALKMMMNGGAGTERTVRSPRCAA